MLFNDAVPCSGRWHLQQLAQAICLIIMVLWTAKYLDQGVEISRGRPNYRFYDFVTHGRKITSFRPLTSPKLGFNLVVLSFKVLWKAKYFVQGLKFQVVLVCVAISCTILPFLTSPLNSFMIILATEVSQSSFFTYIFSDISVNVNRITSSTSAL